MRTICQRNLHNIFIIPIHTYGRTLLVIEAVHCLKIKQKHAYIDTDNDIEHSLNFFLLCKARVNNAWNSKSALFTALVINLFLERILIIVYFCTQLIAKTDFIFFTAV